MPATARSNSRRDDDLITVGGDQIAFRCTSDPSAGALQLASRHRIEIIRPLAEVI